MYRKYLHLGLLCSVAFIMSDTGGSGAGDQSKPTLGQALVRLDPNNEDHWTQSGDPLLAHLETVTGGDVSREDVDKLTNGLKRSDDWKQELADSADLVDDDEGDGDAIATNLAALSDEPAPAPPRKSALDSGRYRADTKALEVSVSQVVYLRSPERGNASGVVSEVHDNGEVDVELEGETVTGVQHVSVVKQLPADAPERNLDAWDFNPA